ncbi:MAG TPA: ParA family protein [Candidatus Brocadiia bacterium]|nr:ParA family protein [Planctomycetota bacterium]
MRCIALANQKGGVGKTTSTANLGACLALLGKKVLVIDLDPQANLSIHLGVNIYENNRSVYHLISGSCKPDEVISKTEIENLHIIPSNIDLAGAEIELVGIVGREIILKENLGNILERYDYVLIDCPPSLGLLTLNALTTANEIFIPLQTEFFALQGVSKLMETFEIVRKRLNHNLEISGIIPCMHAARTKLNQEVLEKIKNYFEDKVFKTIIRKNIKLSESPSYGKPIVTYEPASHGAEDYMALAKEVIARENRLGDTVTAPVDPSTQKVVPQQTDMHLEQCEQIEVNL